MSAWLSIALLNSVQAQEYPTCPQVVDELRGPELLRSLSLDLRGVVPSADEYATLDGDQVPEDLLREYLTAQSSPSRWCDTTEICSGPMSRTSA